LRESVPAVPDQTFPQDLRVWLKGPALLRLASGIAQEHTVSALRPVFSLSATRFHHPWRMLGLLTYGYASGLWHSRAIAEIVALDSRLVELCHGHPPSAELIQRFRIHNRIPILRCLEQLLRTLWCHRRETGTDGLDPRLVAEIVCNAHWRLQRAERSDASESRPPKAGRKLITQGGKQEDTHARV